MKFYWALCVAIVSLFVVEVYGENRVAIAHLVSETIEGSILFTEVADGVRVTGTITGLPEGHYGFHIHEFGDISTCDAAGAHFDLDGNNHGGREHDIRHIGDLGNVEFVGGEGAAATIDLVDKVISLRGRHSVLGRALVLHEGEDDLGLGDNDTSLVTGNAGARAACAVIGIKAGDWNAATITSPSTTRVIFIGLIAYFVKQLSFII